MRRTSQPKLAGSDDSRDAAPRSPTYRPVRYQPDEEIAAAQAARFRKEQRVMLTLNPTRVIERLG